MAKKRFTDKELREAKVPQDEFNDSIKQMFGNQTRRMDVMDENCIEFKILNILRKERNENGKVSCLFPPDIAEKISGDIQIIENLLEDMNDFGHVDRTLVDGCYRITEKGIRQIEPDNPLIPVDEKISIDQSTNISDISGGTITVGNNNIITATEIMKTIDNISKSNISETKKQSLLDNILKYVKGLLLSSDS